MKSWQKQLFSMQDIAYRDFQSSLMPTVPKHTVIGVRMPDLRKFARAFAQNGAYDTFLNTLPHDYYEENNLHMLLIAEVRDYPLCVRLLNRFLPFVDNWATCDMTVPKCFKDHKCELRGEIGRWLQSEHGYTVRYGIEMLMKLYLEEDFSTEYPKMVSQVRAGEYYVDMMAAWYFATALAKQWDAALPFLEDARLSPSVHRKAIQKAIESCRITAEKKAYLKTLRNRI